MINKLDPWKLKIFARQLRKATQRRHHRFNESTDSGVSSQAGRRLKK